MDYLKKAIWGPDPKEQHRKIRTLVRRNGRSLDKSLRELNALQSKTQALIKRSAKQNDTRSVRIYARELYQINKQYKRMYTSKAQLQSVGMKIDEAFRMQSLQENMALSAGLMREINSLVRLPYLQSSMMELEKELVKSGLISEMIDDTMEMATEDEDMEEEAEREVKKIVDQYTSSKLDELDDIPADELPGKEEEIVPDDKIDDEADNMLNEMRERLKALQN
ncbi:ESCRT-III subunit protein VPS24 [Lachancea thermotolerans CBS 6340]|uniref:KLTH0D07568p n=1 Tax=Lachancea thermotolerans (strain ATCC 56472 / CBS 6340 / NRRL Y-8284) TaxID=559295 RepID=C5DGR9_LACTC|nr:KLTH0D07568p [Lachancea thermotolerans CBS 6340]CAR22611.1 KLTH0D07568p [Lachancea thermotolerans CBS 6340]